MQAERMRGESAKQLAIEMLRAARKPLHTKEVATRVIESGRCSGLKGKTPEATVAADARGRLEPGGPFKRVDKGTYTLSDQVAPATAADADQPDTNARPTRMKATQRTTKPKTTAGAKTRSVTPKA